MRRTAFELQKPEAELKVQFLQGLKCPRDFMNLVHATSNLHVTLSALADAVENQYV